MTPEVAIILIVGAVTPVVTGLYFPRWLLRVFAPAWTALPPIGLTYHYMAPAPGERYTNFEALLFPLMIFLFILVWPWIAWSKAVFRLLRERRAGVVHDPRGFS